MEQRYNLAKQRTQAIRNDRQAGVTGLTRPHRLAAFGGQAI
jgi:hypothetical protein